MLQFLGLVVVFVLIIAGILYNCYVRVIQARNSLLEAKSGIDVQFKKRYDLIPNILTIASKFMEHEKEIFTKITELRTQAMNAPAGSNQSLEINSQLDSVLGQLKVSMENYPTLKSDATMLQAMQTYNEVEEHIAAARRFYNSALTQLNNTVMIFPSSMFRNYAADVLDSKYYEAAESEKVSINAGDYLK
ncbi:MAG: LemA family protein [bacterium]|nr:LemA family protein [bacterium]